jgi:drug/metabolite transporter (DMT)-like permease
MRLGWKTLGGVLLYFGTGIAGDLLLKHGISQIPSFGAFTPAEAARFFAAVITNLQVVGGVALLIVNFSMMLAVLSAVDLSVVGPARALNYLFLTLGARVVLGENVPLLRWAGVLLICAGVGLILASVYEAKEERKAEARPVSFAPTELAARLPE